MSRYTPTAITSEYAAIAALNENFSDISVLLDEMLSRYGDSANGMQSDLDLNHFTIRNLANGVNTTDAVSFGQVLGLLSNVTPSSNGNFGVPGLLSALTANIAPTINATLFVRSSLNIANGVLLYSATPDFITAKPLEIIASTLLIEPTSKIAINPTALSYAQGFVINQTSPTSGTKAGPVDFNSIDTHIRATATGTGLPGEAGNAGWNVFRVTGFVGGANFGADQAFGISGALIVDQASTSTCDITGISGAGFVDNVAYAGNIYGMTAAATVANAGASARQIMALECGVSIRSGATTPLRSALNLANYGSGVATTADAALTVTTAGPTGFHTGAFLNFVYLIDPTPGVNMTDGFPRPPLAPTASMFATNTTFPIANVFNLPTVTVTGNILNFPNVQLTGSGNLTMGGSLICTPGSSVVPTVNGQMTIQATSNTSLTFKLKGSDGTLRSASLTLA